MYYGARGIVGLVKPTYRPGSMESFIRLMPEGVGFIPLHVGVRAGTDQEFQQALAIAEKKVAKLAELGADIVMIMGAPPTMVRGYGADARTAEELTQKYRVTVLTATIAQVEAFRALGIRKLVGITYFQDDLNRKFAQFFEDGGFKVAAMKGLDVPFSDAGKIPPEAIYAFAKKVFVDFQHPGAGMGNAEAAPPARAGPGVWAVAGGDAVRTKGETTMSRWKLFCSGLVLTWGCLTGFGAEAQEIRGKAEAEGKMVFYATFNANDSKTIIDGFRQAYPKIDAVFYRATDAQLMERILTEARAGKSLWDVVTTTSFYGHTLKKRGLLAAYDSAERKSYREGYKDPQGFWTSTYTN
ncbi:MAG: hypothetical protein HYU47_14230, partial [Deltaproteobacteria bacterium]|nr:hypothetical protein [Deltaproteobacteria bacterium]